MTLIRPRPRHRRGAPCALLVGLALASAWGCSRHAAPPPPPAPVPAAAQVHDGSPQLILASDGVHIDYRVWGEGPAAVILLHGWACDANYWHAQVQALAAHYTVVAINLAGHGASGSNRKDWSPARHGEDVAAVVRGLPQARVVLVGHAMGADVALETARRLNGRVAGIIAIDSLRGIGLPPIPQGEIDMRLKPFRSDFVGATRRMVTESLFRPDADPQLVQKVAYDMSLEAPEVAVPTLEALLHTDFAAVLRDLHVPVIAINSDLTPTDAARIARVIPGFRLETFTHSGHFPMLEDPPRFNAVLLRELARLAPAAPAPP